MRPKREVATNNGQTYFVTSSTAERRPLFRTARWAELFLATLHSYRPARFLLHGFVLMPDHFHVLIAPVESLERAVQFIKGGFSFRAKKELGWNREIWGAGFSDHRIRDFKDFEVHEGYIARNPVKARLVERPQDYAYSSANGRFDVDPIPQGLKPRSVAGLGGGAEAPPFQGCREPLRIDDISQRQESRRVGRPSESAEAPPFQDCRERRRIDDISQRQEFRMVGRPSESAEAPPFQGCREPLRIDDICQRQEFRMVGRPSESAEAPPFESGSESFLTQDSFVATQESE